MEVDDGLAVIELMPARVKMPRAITCMAVDVASNYFGYIKSY
jgi:hypothetical protein